MSDCMSDEIEIKYILNKVIEIEKHLKSNYDVVIIPNTIKLNATNVTQMFDYNNYYDITFFIVGAVTADVAINVIEIGVNSIANNGIFYINNTLTGYKIKGIRLSSININTANIATANVYVSFVGYKTKKEPSIDILI